MTTFAERLVHEAAAALTPHTPGDDHTDTAAREVAAAVLRAQIDELDAWKYRVHNTVADRRARLAQELGIGLLRLRFLEVLDQIEHPSSPSPERNTQT